MKATRALQISGVFFAIICELATVGIAAAVKYWLDEASLAYNGGLAYQVCFLIAGSTVTAVALYTVYLASGNRWSTARLVRAIRLAFLVSCAAAIGCTLWFIIYPGYMNPTGLGGLLLAITSTGWVCTLSAKVLSHSESE